MVKSTCCSLCLCINKRTLNIYGSDLLYVYENLANFKISDTECWMCYICHTRLRQCHQLQQMAVRTRGLIDDIFQNKIDIKLGSIKSLSELSFSKTKITSSHIKEELHGTTESYEDKGNEEDEILENTSNYKEEGEPHIKSEVAPAQELPNVVKFKRKSDAHQKSKANKLKLVKPVEINVEYAPQNTSSSSQPEDGSEEQNTCEDITVIKLEIKEELREEGVNHYDYEQAITSYTDEGQDQASDLAGCDKRPLSCYVCFKSFPHKSKLIRHIRSHTGEKPFSCKICLRNFAQKSALKSHQLIHTGEKPFSCDICSRKFAVKTHLKNHTLTHTAEKPFSCDVCSKRFPRKSSLINHSLLHTGEKPLCCDICSKKFIKASDLNRHISNIHYGVKPYSCEICLKKFARKPNASRHMQTHTGEQPFSCTICSKKFACKNSLENHTLIHTGDKKHVCHICGKKFTLKRYLDIHLQSHAGLRPFSCDICSKKFTQKSSLNTHKRVH